MNKTVTGVSTFGIQGEARSTILPKLLGFVELHCVAGTQLFPIQHLHVEKNPNGMAIVYHEGVTHEVYETYEEVVTKMRACQ